MFNLNLITFVSVSLLSMAAAAIPTPPVAESIDLIPEWTKIQDTDSARRVIHAINSESSSIAWKGGYVELSVNLTGIDKDRMYWDIPVNLDLRDRNTVEFDIFCDQYGPIAHFTFYLKSGNGWYSCSPEIEEMNEWQHITVKKATMSFEGKPNGWEKIECIRISAWRGIDGETKLGLANIGLPIPQKPKIIIIRADSQVTVNKSESKGFQQFANNLQVSFDTIGLPATTVADLDVTDGTIQGIPLVCLPYNPRVPNSLIPILRRYHEQGGKLLLFYSIPKEITSLIGLDFKQTIHESSPLTGFLKTKEGFAKQPDYIPHSTQWAGIIGKGEVPVRTIAMWKRANGEHTDYPAICLTPSGAYFSHVWHSESAPLLREIAAELNPAWKGHFQEVEKKQAERDQADARWIASIPSKKGEFRAYWCHSPWGVADLTWDEAIRQLKENGFTAIIPNMAWGANASFASQVLAPTRDFKERGDALETCLAACRKYGIQCHVWKVCWNTFWKASPDELAELERQGRVQVGKDGTTKAKWLCPSHPANQQQEIDAMVEIAGKGVDGIHFDYIRYPDTDSCFCPGCRARFEAFVQHAVTNWPGDTGKALKNEWTAFRCAQITKVVQGTATIVRKKYPKCSISAAVFQSWPGTQRSIGQDWGLWCEKGWLDAVHPMDYTEANSAFRSQVTKQRIVAGKTKLYPGIGLSCWSNRKDAVRVTKQIEFARQANADGFTIFNYDTSSLSLLQLLHKGPPR
ncbi:MAG: family 10 glycosylhydrolase [Kiritimatiellae bacterium]|nr:family 10 glycosylhydrolase [Kiritimatiellia bacterium]